MNFTVYATQQFKCPVDLPTNHATLVESLLQPSLDYLIENKFDDVCVAIVIKKVLEDSLLQSKVSIGADKTRAEYAYSCENFAEAALKIISYVLNNWGAGLTDLGKCLYRADVEVRWDGEVKAKVHICPLPSTANFNLDLKFTTLDKFRNLEIGNYLIVLFNNSEERGDYLSYTIASVHPNVIVIGGCFLSDYSPNLIAGYAKLDLDLIVENVLPENFKLWKRKQ